MLYALARPLLFRLDPERAHALTLELADAPLRFGLLRVARAPQPERVVGTDPLLQVERGFGDAFTHVHARSSASLNDKVRFATSAENSPSE